jgi:dinuclear metal center YbgI/SA1388 family protein
MLKLKELCRYLNDFLPSHDVSDYCLNGLQIEGKSHINQLATAVSASLETIEAAVEHHVDVLIVHHGLFWQRDSYAIQGVKRKKIALLLDQGISLLAYHLPLDMHPQVGNNWKAAQDLGWADIQPFAYMDKVPIGVKGKFAPCTREEFKQRLEQYYQHPAVCAWGGAAHIQSAALVSGGAYKSLLEAAQEGVDAFITGNYDEPAWYQAQEEGINFLALGHAATERVGPLALAKHLEQMFHLPCRFLDIKNPF